MRLGLHFFEADTPPFCGSKTPEKSEIYQDLGKSTKPPISSPQILKRFLKSPTCGFSKKEDSRFLQIIFPFFIQLVNSIQSSYHTTKGGMIDR